MSDTESVLLLARHGRTEWNRSGRYQGRSDVPLSPEGRADAVALAARISAEPVGAIVSSPLRRAVQTAEIVAERFGAVPFHVEPRLVEIAYGSWEGLTQAEINARLPEDLRCWKRYPDAMRFPGGETLEEARHRLLDALAVLPSGTTCLVVTHSGLIRLALLEARGLRLPAFRSIPVQPGSVCRLRLRGAGASSVALGEMPDALPCAS